jgi:hypothetical protein
VPDTATMRRAIGEYQTACARDGGALWGKTLCGPLLLIDRATRMSVASESPPDTGFRAMGAVFIGPAPGNVPFANTASLWHGRWWAFALTPLPTTSVARTHLLIHEAFHRIQGELGLSGIDALNNHLNERDGRYWYILELRAAAAALRLTPETAHQAVQDALLFRTYRHTLFPGADTLERALELQEGLAEYTGQRLAFAAAADAERYAAEQLTAFESRATFVRSAGYGSGPALGLLLDRYAPGWRGLVNQKGLAPQLAEAVGFVPPSDLASRARERVEVYGGRELAAAEDARELARQKTLTAYRSRLVEGPVLVLRQEGLMRSFNPNTLVPLPEGGTIYPTGTFSAEWGTIEVKTGALVAANFQTLTLPAPADTTPPSLQGPDWVLRLSAGWVLVPGPRRGDFTVVRKP